MFKIILYLVFAIGVFIHYSFFKINEILKIPDSFAYLQMSHFLKNFDINGFGTGWFGFLYSLFIAIVSFFTDLVGFGEENSLFLASKILNIVLLVITGVILYKIGKIYLNKTYVILLMILFFTSSIIIHYNTNILSENIYLPLFLGLFLFLHKFIKDLSLKNSFIKILEKNIYVERNTYKLNIIIIGFFVALMYYTRAESFIYLLSVFLIIAYLFLKKEIRLKKLIKMSLLLILSFFIFISPYIYYLHTITGEWGITNKGSSNLRQAEMRGIENMDNLGFEKAVGELTNDKKHLISGFAGGLKYDKPEIKYGLKDYIIKNPTKTIKRFLTNQKKLYSFVIPKLLIGDSIKLYKDEKSMFYKAKLFLIFLLLPLILLIYGGAILIFEKKNSEKRLFIPIFLSFFLIASFFFTIFFVLDRYFLIFLPLLLLVMVYGSQEVLNKIFILKHTDSTNHIPLVKRIGFIEFKNTKIQKLKGVFICIALIYIFYLGTINYYNSNKLNDEKVKLKKEAGLWINKNYGEKDVIKNTLNIMERFPIVTYYSGTKNRWIIPYTNNLNDIITYAKYNKIELLIVDTMDFLKYRPSLSFLLNHKKNHKGLRFLNKFKSEYDLVVIYTVN